MPVSDFINAPAVLDALEARALSLVDAPDPAPEGVALSENAAALRDFIACADFGCRRGEVARLVSLIIGEDVTTKEEAPTHYAPPVGSVAVIVGDSDFQAGAPYLITDVQDGSDAYAFTDEGVETYVSRDGLRPATAEQVAAAFARYREDTVRWASLLIGTSAFKDASALPA
jgi:hypothetical protein